MSKNATFTIIGASNHTEENRQEDDFYATDPIALKALLEVFSFDDFIWECACGNGSLSKVFDRAGYCVKSTDLYDRGYGISGVDFLKQKEKFNGDIVTNPPFKFAEEFVRHAIDLVQNGNKVAMFLKLTFLESQKRRKLFEEYPPKYVYVSSGRIQCAKNGDFEKYRSGSGTAIAYAWFIWEKGFYGEPKIRWFN